MSIIIKELFPSDPLSEALEKINFNFDQMVLSGGGPPGPQGDKGPQGIAGPKGDDGTRWFTGESTPTGALTDDVWLKKDGTVWKYVTNTWTNTGVTLIGGTGATGLAGSSMEIKLYPGRTGGSLTGSNDSWMIEPSASLASDTTTPNFIVPTNSHKNSLYLGPLTLSNSNFSAWNSLDLIKGTIPSTRTISKLTMIQNAMDYTGYGGLTIGARGATSSIISDSNPSTNLNILGENTFSSINARDFFNAGYYIKSPRTDNNAYLDRLNQWTHGFLLSMYTMDLDLQAGTQRGQNIHTSLGDSKIPSLNFKSYRIHLEDFERNRTIYSGYNTISTTLAQSFIEINAKPSTSNVYIATPTSGTTTAYIGLQTQQNTPATGFSHGYGSVLIGPTGTGNYPISRDIRSALHISRPISKFHDNADATSIDSHITLWNGNENGIDDFIARFSGVKWPGYDSGRGYLLLQSRKFGITSRLATSNWTAGATMIGFIPKFPLHVINRPNEQFANINHIGFVGEGSVNSLLIGALAGFDSVVGPGQTAAAGLAIVNYRNSATDQRWTPVPSNPENIPTEIGINTYWSGPNVGKWAGYLSGSTFVPLSNPDLHLQVGPELGSGNVALGFIGNPTAGATQSSNVRAWSKLSVNGSITVGTPTTFHTPWVNKPSMGILSEGPIWRGSNSLTNYFPMKVIGVTGAGLVGGYPTQNMHSFSQYMSTNPTLGTEAVINKQMGILTTRDVGAEGYVAFSNQSRAWSYALQNRWNPSYSLFDFRTGIDMQQISEGLLVVNNQKNTIIGASGATSLTFSQTTSGTNDLIISTINTPAATAASSYQSITTAKFTNRTDFAGLTGPGFQVTSRFATQPRYLSTNQLEQFITPYYGAIHRKNTTRYADMQWEGFVLTLPTDSSTLVLDLNPKYEATTQVKQFTSHTYNMSTGLITPPTGATNIPRMDQWTPPALGTTSGIGVTAWGLATAPRNISCLQYPTTDTNIHQQQPSNLVVTLQEGLYDGQEFTLIINSCDATNRLTMTGDPIPTSYTAPVIIDDNDPNNIVGNAAYLGYIQDAQRVILGLDTDNTQNGLPYTVPVNTALDTVAKISDITNYQTYSINNVGQSLNGVPAGATTMIGDNRVSSLQASRGAFKFAPNRTITFKWVVIGRGPTTSTGTDDRAGNLLTRFFANGTTGGTFTINRPIPNVIRDYFKDQVANNSSGPVYAWVEISRTYNAQGGLSPFYMIIPKL